MAAFVSMATCHTCSKTSRSVGVNRATVAALSKTHSTPGNSGKPKTAGQTPSSAGGKAIQKSAEKTPYGSARSASSKSAGTPSSSKRNGGKTSAFARLRKILKLSNTPKKEKGTLKAFLSSL